MPLTKIVFFKVPLDAMGIDIGLLINFGKSVSVRRKFRTTRKKSC